MEPIKLSKFAGWEEGFIPAVRGVILGQGRSGLGPLGLGHSSKIPRTQEGNQRLTVINLAGLPSDQFAQVERELDGHRSLTDMLNWSQCQPPGTLVPQVISDVVVQDEFTHDVIVPWGESLVLVYDTT